MKPFPFETFEIESNKTAGHVSSAISDITQKWSWSYALGKQGKPLIGQCEDGAFKLYRAIKYRNSFLPIAIGRITSTANGSIVSVKLRIHLAVLVFMAIWFSGVVAACLLMAVKPSGVQSLIPYGMLVFGYALVEGCFWGEVGKIKKILLEAVK